MKNSICKYIHIATLLTVPLALDAQTPTDTAEPVKPSETTEQGSVKETPAVPQPAPDALEGTTNTASTPAANVAPTQASPANATSPSTSPSDIKDTLSVDFPDSDIRDVLRNVADLFDLNIIIPDTLAGRTTLKLRDVTWRQIYKVVLSQVGYTFIERGNIVEIVSISLLESEPVTTELIELKAVIPSILADTLKNFLNKAGASTKDAAGQSVDNSEKVVVIPQSNFIALTATPARLLILKELIRNLDIKQYQSPKSNRQIMIETKFIEVSNINAKDIGVNWSSLQKYNVGVSEAQQQYTRTKTSGNESERTADNAINNSSTISLPNNVLSGASSVTSGLALTDTINSGVETERIATAVFSAAELNVILSALQTKNQTKLVSNPTLIAFDNKEATLHVGKEIPVSGGGSVSGSSGTAQKNPAQRVKEGIILNFTPSIVNLQTDKDSPPVDAIRLDLSKPSTKVKVEDAAGGITLRSANGEKVVDGSIEPIFETRSVGTEVILKDGYTMGIGGMISSRDTQGETKVPVLGSIPVIGRLFRSNSNFSETTNLLVFITTKIIYPVETDKERRERIEKESKERLKTDFVAKSTINPNITQSMKIQRGDLPGYVESEDSPFYTPPPEKVEPKDKETKREATRSR